MNNLINIQTITSNKVTIKDIAKVANVSVAAVSNALSDKPNISDSVKKKILSVAKEMNYTPNTTARSLNRANIKIAVILSDNPFEITEKFINGIKRAVGSHSGAKLECDIITYSTTNEHAAAAFEKVLCGNYDGLIISFPNIHEYKHQELIEKINALNIPIVSFVDELSIFNTRLNVMVDAAAGGNIAADIIGNSAQNKKSAVFTAVNPLQVIHRNYVEGYKTGLAFYGNEISDIFYSTDVSNIAYERAMDCFSQKNHPYGAFTTCYNAFEVCKAVEKLKLTGKVKVVGVDLTEQNEKYLLKGSLTAVIYQRQEEQAIRAFNETVSIIVNRSDRPYKNILVTPNIITRGRLTKDKQ